MPRTKPRPRKSSPLPPWRVILHNDDINSLAKIIDEIMRVTRLPKNDAKEKAEEAQKEGSSILLMTHREKAELYQELFVSCHPPITVTIEPA